MNTVPRRGIQLSGFQLRKLSIMAPNHGSQSPFNVDEKTITVMFQSLRVSDHDIEQCLQHVCTLLQRAMKPVDNNRIWKGLRRYKVRSKRRSDGEAVQIPNNIMLGPNSGVFNQGPKWQPIPIGLWSK